MMYQCTVLCSPRASSTVKNNTDPEKDQVHTCSFSFAVVIFVKLYASHHFCHVQMRYVGNFMLCWTYLQQKHSPSCLSTWIICHIYYLCIPSTYILQSMLCKILHCKFDNTCLFDKEHRILYMHVLRIIEHDVRWFYKGELSPHVTYLQHAPWKHFAYFLWTSGTV